MQGLIRRALDASDEARLRGDHGWAAFWVAMVALYATLADDEGRGP